MSVSPGFTVYETSAGGPEGAGGAATAAPARTHDRRNPHDQWGIRSGI
jgi:hypothetical protein